MVKSWRVPSAVYPAADASHPVTSIYAYVYIYVYVYAYAYVYACMYVFSGLP